MIMMFWWCFWFLDGTGLIDRARDDLKLTLDMLEKEDIKDATEKAWRTIKNIHKSTSGSC